MKHPTEGERATLADCRVVGRPLQLFQSRFSDLYKVTESTPRRMDHRLDPPHTGAPCELPPKEEKTNQLAIW